MLSGLKIGNHEIGPDHPCFLIAEIGSNHDGSLTCAKELIEAAAEAKVNAVKFQSIKFDELYLSHLESAEFKKFIQELEIPEDWYPELAECAINKGLYFLSSPTYVRAVALLEQVGVPAYKIASPQATANPALLRYVARLRKPIILSTGYSTYCEIAAAVQIVLEESNQNLALLHCISEYPTAPEKANLNAIQTLQSMFGLPCGFSDHTLGFHITVAAVAKGACLIEKHFTLDRKRQGPDHFFALEPDELCEMVRTIRDVEASLGDGRRTQITDKESEIRASIRTRLVSKVDIPEGTEIQESHLLHRRAPYGIYVEELHYVTHTVAAKWIPALTPLTWDKLRFVKS